MKFIKLVVKNTQSEIDIFISNLDCVSFDFLMRLYRENQFIYLNTADGFGVTYAFFPEKDIIKLASIYDNYGIDFKYTDITHDILFGIIPKLDGGNNDILIDFANNFIKENLDKDIILEKISKMGFDSLSVIDKEILYQ